MTEAPVQQRLDDATTHLEAGRLLEAETAFRAVLAEMPDRTEALDGLGLVLRDTERADEALDCFKRAVMAQPDNANAQLHMAETLVEVGRFDAAVTAYRRLTALLPDFAPLHAALGVAQKRAGDPEAAVVSYERAEALDPADPAAPFNRALALEELGRQADAAAAYEKTLSIAPELVEARVNLGNILLDLDRPADAVTAYRRALEAIPDHADTWSRLGVALDATGQTGEALDCYRKAIALDPSCADAHYNLGIALRERGDLDQAIASYRQALSANPTHADAHFNLGVAQQAGGDTNSAEASYRAALAENPDQDEARNNLGTVQGDLNGAMEVYRQGVGDDPAAATHANTAWNLGLALLLAGDFAEGWKWYEWRFHKLGGKPPEFDVPRWSLDANPDARVLVHAEQGYGDTLHFVRYVPMVAERCAGVVLEVQPNLRRLLDGFGGAETVAAGETLPTFDHHIPLLSLPGLFATTVETIPGDVPYLGCDPERRDYWCDRLAGDGRAIGVSWRGNPENPNDIRRSMDPGVLRPLLNLPGYRFYSLQKVPAEGDWEILEQTGPIADLGPDLGDFAETAAVIEALDLVITVDTATAHLAGALGAPTWIPLPFVPDWRWMTGREDSPWYPSARLFRQDAPDTWPAVIDRIVQELGG